MPSAIQIQPYLFFEGRCEEALEFYKKAAGAEILNLMRGKDSPDPGIFMAGSGLSLPRIRFRISAPAAFL